ncbi:MAG: Gfo/Idh/MocA family oxidoreductase [Actinobacteria bacterium]|nr:Gfo/Idh/MocA family oxidoreductase [Actinomycetota bacterium]
MKGSTLRAGVVGVGSMGENHARIYSCLPDVELVGVCDVDYRRAALVAEKFGTVAFHDLEHLLDSGIDVVSIAVPASGHHEAVSKCARAGCHILLEKPLAADLSQAEKIILESQLNGVRIMVGHVERFNPVVRVLKEILDVDEVISIDIVRVGPKPPRIKDVGVIKDMGIHDIDLLRYLTGKEIASLYSLVAGEGAKEDICRDREDIGILAFRMENGILGQLTVNWITPFKVRKIQIAGSTDFIEGDLFHRKVRLYRKGRDGNTCLASEIPIVQEEPLETEIKIFLDCILDGREFPISLSDALRALEIAELCTNKPGELIICHSPAGSGGTFLRGGGERND